jgi:hypothetical protein
MTQKLDFNLICSRTAALLKESEKIENLVILGDKGSDADRSCIFTRGNLRDQMYLIMNGAIELFANYPEHREMGLKLIVTKLVDFIEETYPSREEI